MFSSPKLKFFSRDAARERMNRVIEANPWVDPLKLLSPRPDRASSSQGPPNVENPGGPSRPPRGHPTSRKILHEDPEEPVRVLKPKLTTEEVLASVDEGFFEEGFDGLGYFLARLPPDGCDVDALRSQEELMLKKLEIVSSAVNGRVMENYSEFVEGISLVSELQTNLTLSNVIVKNGRRFLGRAQDEVCANIRIADLNRKKGHLMEVLEKLHLLQVAHNTEELMRSKLDEEDFMEAIYDYVKGHGILNEMQDIKCEEELRVKLTETSKMLMERLDNCIQIICQNFQTKEYSKFLSAYLLLLEVRDPVSVEMASLDNKIQDSFARAVDRETDGVLKAYALTMEGSEAVRRQGSVGVRVQYKELCRHLPAEYFYPCLCKTLEALFNLFCSHYRMMTWHLDKSKEGAQRAAHVLPSAGAASTSGRGEDELQSVPAEVRLSNGDADVEGDISPGRGGERDAARADSGESTPATYSNSTQEASSVSESDRTMYKAIAASMHRGAKTVWELASMRVSTLLNTPSAPEGSNFIQVLDLAQSFIKMGEAFTRMEATALRGHVAKINATFFGAKQRRQLDVLCMMLEKEMWQRLPYEAVPHIRQELRRSAREAALPSAQRNSAQAFLNQGKDDGMFQTWVEGQNPFTDVERKSMDEFHKGKGEEASAGEAELEEEEEDEELHGDFIDEETQSTNTHAKAGSRRELKVNSTEVHEGLSATRPTITAASVHFLRCLAEYMWLTWTMGRGSSIVFAATKQLFDCYFFFIFKAFGKQEALEKGSNDLTPRLHQTLLRLQKHGVWSARKLEQQASAADPWSYTSSGNMYGLKERCAAIESLHTIADELKRVRPVLESHLGVANQKDIEQFFSRTVDAVEDLREHIYKAAAKLLLSVEWLLEEIGDSEKIGASKKYDRKELGMQHNPWVDRLINEFKQFGAKVACADVPPQTATLLWEYAAESTADLMVDGFSRVRKCTEMGRGCMSLDLQVILQWVKKQMNSTGREPNMRIVDNYIKAFYVPETELLHWAMTHPEYTRAQIIALINQISSAYNWPRRRRTDLLAQVEESLMH